MCVYSGANFNILGPTSLGLKLVLSYTTLVPQPFPTRKEFLSSEIIEEFPRSNRISKSFYSILYCLLLKSNSGVTVLKLKVEDTWPMIRGFRGCLAGVAPVQNAGVAARKSIAETRLIDMNEVPSIPSPSWGRGSDSRHDAWYRGTPL
jgi:hypothetical protein